MSALDEIEGRIASVLRNTDSPAGSQAAAAKQIYETLLAISEDS